MDMGFELRQLDSRACSFNHYHVYYMQMLGEQWSVKTKVSLVREREMINSKQTQDTP